MTVPNVQFPANIVALISEKIALIDKVVILNRPLRSTDSDLALGIYATEWLPGDYEIGNVGPTLQRYMIRIEALVKHASEEEARTQQALLAKSVRMMLYADDDLRVRLGQLQETVAFTATNGITTTIRERVQKWGIRYQRFAANDVQGQFLHLSTLDLWVETETRKL